MFKYQRPFFLPDPQLPEALRVAYFEKLPEGGGEVLMDSLRWETPLYPTERGKGKQAHTSWAVHI